MKCQHNTSNFQNTDSRRERTVKRDYDIQPSVLESGNSEEVCQEDTSPIVAADEPTIIEDDNEAMSEGNSSLVVDFTAILLQVAKKGD